MAANERAALLKESRKSLSRAKRDFEGVYQGQDEFSLAAERVRELFTELRTWLEDYSDEVRGVPPVVQSGENLPVGEIGDVSASGSTDEGAGQSETASPNEVQ